MKKVNVIENGNGVFAGCDFVVTLGEERVNTDIRILQLTDMQIIDASQRRTPDRIRADEINAWAPENFDVQCGDHIRSLVNQSRPDLIIITGDIVYGSFDDNGSVLDYICRLMDSFCIPWAPVFGNHDNESRIGIDWQCERFENSEYCLFKRGEVSGNGNYTVGVAVGDRLLRVLHMLDSNGCRGAASPSVIKEKGIFPDQIELVKANTTKITQAQGGEVPAFMAFHIPVDCFREAEMAKKYRTEDRKYYNIGVDVPALDGDFGFCYEESKRIETDGSFIDLLKSQNVEGVFAGHEHNVCTCIEYMGIKWVLGLKTGQYDYHIPGQLGATLITLNGKKFSVSHIPALVKYAPMPGQAKMFENIFASNELT